MLCLVHRVNTGVRAGLFIYKAFSLSAVFPSLAFGSLQSFRKETDLAGMFFVPSFLFTGEKRNRFIITALGGGRGGGEKVSGSTSMSGFFFFFFFLMLNLFLLLATLKGLDRVSLLKRSWCRAM